MTMRDLQEGLKIISANTELAHFSGRKSQELVHAAEAALGVLFPPTYRAFLIEVGCGDIAGAEFFGIIDDDFENSSVPDAIWLTLDERRVSDLPRNLIIVYDLGEGTYYALDTIKRHKDGECHVVAWVPGIMDNQGLDVVAEDFGELFLNTVKFALQQYEP